MSTLSTTGTDEAAVIDTLVSLIVPADGAGAMDVYVGADGSVIGRTIASDDDSFLLRLGFSEEEMEEFLTASLAKEMAGRLPAYCRQADGRPASARRRRI